MKCGDSCSHNSGGGDENRKEGGKDLN